MRLLVTIILLLPLQAFAQPDCGNIAQSDNWVEAPLQNGVYRVFTCFRQIDDPVSIVLHITDLDGNGPEIRLEKSQAGDFVPGTHYGFAIPAPLVEAGKGWMTSWSEESDGSRKMNGTAPWILAQYSPDPIPVTVTASVGFQDKDTGEIVDDGQPLKSCGIEYGSSAGDLEFSKQGDYLGGTEVSVQVDPILSTSVLYAAGWCEDEDGDRSALTEVSVYALPTIPPVEPVPPLPTADTRPLPPPEPPRFPEDG